MASLVADPSEPLSPMSEPASPAGKGGSPFPSILQERSPTTGALTIGWGINSPTSSPMASFRRTSKPPLPNLLGASSPKFCRRAPPPLSAAEDVPPTPSTLEALEERPSPNDITEEMIDERLVDVVRDLKDVKCSLAALQTLQNTSSPGPAAEAALVAANKIHAARGPTVKDVESPTGATSSPAAAGARWRPPLDAPPSADWEVRKRHEHASRLLDASVKASKGAARKMLAMATNEQLRTTQPNALLELEREQAVRRRRPSHEADKYILPVHREHDEDYDGDARSASTPSKGSPKAVGFAAEPSESERAQPLTCFVTSVMRSVHILLGCEVK